MLLRKYSRDVVHHFDARFRTLLQVLQKLSSLGKYKLANYFYRIEFQQRGSAHAHCVLWLADEAGNPPPAVDVNSESSKERFLTFIDSIIKTTKETKSDNASINNLKHITILLPARRKVGN